MRKRPTENVSFTPLQTLTVPWEILVDFLPTFWKPPLSLPYWVSSNLTGLSNRWKQEKMWKNKQDGKIEKDSVTVQLNTSFKSSYYSEFESNESGFSLRNKSPLT